MSKHWKVNNSFAFTLIEMLTVVVLLGVLAAFAIPNYTKGVEKSYEKGAIANLMAVYAAQKTYYYNIPQSAYYVTGASDNTVDQSTAINTNLGLGIMPNGMAYNCITTVIPPALVTNYTCTAYKTSFTLEVKDPLSCQTPCCVTGICPTAAACAGGC